MWKTGKTNLLVLVKVSSYRMTDWLFRCELRLPVSNFNHVEWISNKRNPWNERRKLCPEDTLHLARLENISENWLKQCNSKCVELWTLARHSIEKNTIDSFNEKLMRGWYISQRIGTVPYNPPPQFFRWTKQKFWSKHACVFKKMFFGTFDLLFNYFFESFNISSRKRLELSELNIHLFSASIFSIWKHPYNFQFFPNSHFFWLLAIPE